MFKNINLFNLFFKTEKNQATDSVKQELSIFRNETEQRMKMIAYLLDDAFQKNDNEKLYSQTKIGFKK